MYTALYAFTFFAGLLMGNVRYAHLLLLPYHRLTHTTQDAVILSATPFLAYFTQATKIEEPIAWVISEFVAANIGMYSRT
jgi:hypothetical protein